ncbi:hypothetical protein H6P81_014943 [Aristolochia fimbriata]|uniref:TF-B3 domain-containing protein n=1 Tax=Aristolochia fimbriata TaxID=158543 RepID=A0AAV7E433_ARIFI|nr:hypothetical protein H6P81_014943 [Aristolochia fimbriata]
MKFFKILLPGFEKKLALPPAFSIHLNGEDTRHRNAILSSDLGGSWPVKIGVHRRGMWFLKGWSEFVADHGLFSLDFLLFEYQGDLRFRVTVFGRNACERDFVCLVHDEEQVVEEEEEESTDDARRRRRRTEEVEYDDLSFEVRINKFTYSTPVFIPLKCRRAMRLRQSRIESVKIQGEDGRSWTMEVRQGPDRGYFCSRGWKPFHKEMGLKQGDVCIFKLCSPTLIKFALLRSPSPAAAH